LLKYNTVEKKHDLLNIVRTRSQYGYFPCQLQPANASHRYQYHIRDRFQFRCGNTTCRHTINGGVAIQWIARLIADGKLPQDTVGYAAAPAAQAVHGAPDRVLVASRFIIPRRDELVRLDTCPVLYRTNHVAGDGNCMFTALANALGQAGVTHKAIRRNAILWARDNLNFINNFLGDDDMDAIDYLHNMAKLGVWGDNIMLEAACRAYGVHVWVLKATPSGALVWMQAGDDEQEGESFGLYLSGRQGAEHYENLVSIEEVYRI
jgi:hypothetical protein